VSTENLRGAVLGFPIAHSLSPLLHKTAFKALGITGEYTAIEVSGGGLQKFLEERGDEFDYLSLTMPLKEEVIELQSSSKVNVKVDELGKRIQSINTLVKTSDGWSATSTDGSGFVESLANAGYDRFERVLVLGAGGTARAVAGALDDIASSVDVMRRSVRRSPAIAACFQKIECSFLDWDDSVDLSSYDLVVNTTPSGAADLVAENLSRNIKGLLFDVLYKPWPTLLARRWSDSGGKTISGLELLLYQGIDQLSLVTDFAGKSIDKELRIALGKASN
jgi:shikimate dehydrogenase